MMLLLSFGFLIIIGIIFGSGYIMCSNMNFIKKTTIMCLLINISLIGAIVLSSLVSIETALSVSITLVPIMLIIDWYMLKETKSYVKRNRKVTRRKEQSL